MLGTLCQNLTMVVMPVRHYVMTEGHDCSIHRQTVVHLRPLRYLVKESVLLLCSEPLMKRLAKRRARGWTLQYIFASEITSLYILFNVR
jgi:hypothetical protein